MTNEKNVTSSANSSKGFLKKLYVEKTGTFLYVDFWNLNDSFMFNIDNNFLKNSCHICKIGVVFLVHCTMNKMTLHNTKLTNIKLK